MTKKLTPSHIAVAVAAGLTAQTALAQNPPLPQPSTGSGQEVTPMIKLDKNQYSGQGFFEKPAQNKSGPKTEEKPTKAAAQNELAPTVSVIPAPVAPPAATASTNKGLIKDPMLPLDIVGSKDAKENTKGGLTPPLAKKDSAPTPAVASLKKPEALLEQAEKPNVTAEKGRTKSESLVKASAPVATGTTAKKKPPVVKKAVVKKAVAKKAIVESPFSPIAKEAVPVEVKELPSAAEPVAPALYAALPSTPIFQCWVMHQSRFCFNKGAIFVEKQCGYAADLKLLRQVGFFVHVHLDHLHPPWVNAGQALKMRLQHPARPAPGCPKIHDHELSGLDNFVFKIVRRSMNNGF